MCHWNMPVNRNITFMKKKNKIKNEQMSLIKAFA